MRELELRLSLVCFGGSSLAIYMNGISAELLQLARASAHLDRQRMLNPARPLGGTGLLWRELLAAIAPKRKLTVVIDAIAGASAGGLNGIFLARALAHDLSLTPLREMWLNLGDIEELMRDYSLAAPWSKAYLYPLIWLTTRRNEGFQELDPESQRKLKQFVRSRWFQPPFNGPRMLDWMISAAENMGRVHPSFSLMPPAHGLDLYVTVTNFYGTTRRVALHDPSLIRERMHEKSLRFRYRRPIVGDVTSDLDDGNVAALGFAARATSSFPGAFPPVTLEDLDTELKRRGLDWPHEEAFLARNFTEHLTTAEDRAVLRKMAFLDGGITNNKPFAEALEATLDRPAHRQVDRRVIFVDPAPEPVEDRITEAKPVPSFFRVLLGALAEIPRSDPIFGDLRRINDLNENFHRVMRTVRAIERDVAPLIDDIVHLDGEQQPDTDVIADWRERAQDLALARVGYASTGYLHLRVSRTLDDLTTLLRDLFLEVGRRYARKAIADHLLDWARSNGLLEEVCDPHASARVLQAQIDFLKDFDVDARLRRVRHVLRHLNAVMAGPEGMDDRMMARLRPEKFKRRLYVAVERGQKLRSPVHLISLLTPEWRDKLDQRLKAEGQRDAPSLSLFQVAMEVLVRLLNLQALDSEMDSFIAGSLLKLDAGDVRDGLFKAYIGFDFVDTVTFPMVAQLPMKELQEVKVDRISPDDCKDLTPHLDRWPLLGTSLYYFGAFFSRRARENDYLWGRMHAAYRMLRLVMDSAGGVAALPDNFNWDEFERRLLRQILLEERPNLPHVHDIIDDMLQRLSG